MARRVVKDPDIRRQELLESAMRLFVERGYDDTAVQSITDDVGVAKGTFYHYFTSKEDLLGQLVEWQTDLLFGTVEARSRETQGRPVEELRELMGTFLQWKYSEGREITIAFTRLLFQPRNLQMRVRLITESTRRLHPLLVDVVEEGVSLGQFHVHDAEAAADIIVAIYRGVTEELFDLLMGAAEHPENFERVISHVRAVENAIERVLGIPDDTLRLYDYDQIRGVFSGLAPTTGDDA